MVQQPVVDVTGLGLELLEVLQPSAAAQVTGVVDDGFDPQRPASAQSGWDLTLRISTPRSPPCVTQLFTGTSDPERAGRGTLHDS